MTPLKDDRRRQQRATDRAQRDHDRRVRQLALRILADMAECDPTISGATLIAPDGSTEFVSADPMRRRGMPQ